ncbi:MAG: hypothetical protein WAO98_07875, partial [Alphaproteobacteria bacterium]
TSVNDALEIWVGYNADGQLQVAATADNFTAQGAYVAVMPIMAEQGLHAVNVAPGDVYNAANTVLGSSDAHFMMVARPVAEAETIEREEQRLINQQNALTQDQAQQYQQAILRAQVNARNSLAAASMQSMEVQSALTGMINSMTVLAAKMGAYSTPSLDKSRELRSDLSNIIKAMEGQNIKDPVAAGQLRAGLQDLLKTRDKVEGVRPVADVKLAPAAAKATHPSPTAQAPAQTAKAVSAATVGNVTTITSDIRAAFSQATAQVVTPVVIQGGTLAATVARMTTQSANNNVNAERPTTEGKVINLATPKDTVKVEAPTLKDATSKTENRVAPIAKDSATPVGDAKAATVTTVAPVAKGDIQLTAKDGTVQTVKAEAPRVVAGADKTPVAPISIKDGARLEARTPQTVGEKGAPLSTTVRSESAPQAQTLTATTAAPIVIASIEGAKVAPVALQNIAPAARADAPILPGVAVATASVAAVALDTVQKVAPTATQAVLTSSATIVTAQPQAPAVTHVAQPATAIIAPAQQHISVSPPVTNAVMQTASPVLAQTIAAVATVEAVKPPIAAVTASAPIASAFVAPPVITPPPAQLAQNPTTPVMTAQAAAPLAVTPLAAPEAAGLTQLATNTTSHLVAAPEMPKSDPVVSLTQLQPADPKAEPTVQPAQPTLFVPSNPVTPNNPIGGGDNPKQPTVVTQFKSACEECNGTKGCCSGLKGLEVNLDEAAAFRAERAAARAAVATAKPSLAA